MKELSIEEKAKAYDKALERAKALNNASEPMSGCNVIIETIFPELKESEDERIRKEMIAYMKHPHSEELFPKAWIDWLEKQGEKKPAMIQWKGDNLKEVIDFVGKYDRFDVWFSTWEQYEEYVHKHDNILKLFNEDGSHYEVPVGAWIVKTPDGYNIPTIFTFKQKPADKVEPKFKVGDVMRTFQEAADNITDGMPVVVSIDNEYYRCNNEIIAIKNQDNYEYPPINRKHNAWSKEDKDMFGIISDLLWEGYKMSGGKPTWEEIRDWFRSNYPHKQWKPSDEQMDALNLAIGEANSVDTAAGDEAAEILTSLYEQLKKLRE